MTSTTAIVDVGGLWYEILVPAFDVERLRRRIGQDVSLHTIHYLEGDLSHGQAVPRLVGFSAETDRDFFRLFTTVKGVGIRKALRAMTRPVAEVASAIQSKDSRLLKALPGIGQRAAETIIAELHGKAEPFAGQPVVDTEIQVPEAGEEAIAVLVQLGERRADALALVERVLSIAPELTSPEAILQHAYKLKAGGL